MAGSKRPRRSPGYASGRFAPAALPAKLSLGLATNGVSKQTLSRPLPYIEGREAINVYLPRRRGAHANSFVSPIPITTTSAPNPRARSVKLSAFCSSTSKVP